MLLLGSCTDDGHPNQPRDFAFVRLSLSGGVCAACFRVLSVESPGVFVASDSDGEERFDLRKAEYESIVESVTSDSLRKVLDQDEEHECIQPSDIEVELEVGWKDDAGVEKHRATVSNGCVGHCDEPTHPLMRIKRKLFELKERYVECLAAECRYPEYCGTAMDVTPEQRRLCSVCMEDCGVPIPDGSPKLGDPGPTAATLEKCIEGAR
jgi:hypothetical protein